MAAHQAPLSLRFSRQEHWSELPFPSPMQESEKWKWSRSCLTLCDPMDCSLSIWDLLPSAQKPPTLYTCPGFITPCTEDLSPPAQSLPPLVQLQMPSQLKITQNILPDLHFPYGFHRPPFKHETSVIPLALSLDIRLTITPPCLNKGNLPLLRSSLLLFCLSPNYTLPKTD